MLVIDDRLAIPLSELHFTFVRSSGPGGQNVNKTNTKVTLRWAVVDSSSLPEDVRSRFLKQYARRVNQRGELLLTSQRFRDQGRNVADCLEKLREMLRFVATPPKTRRRRQPTRASRERRLHDKRKRAESKRLRQHPSRDD